MFATRRSLVWTTSAAAAALAGAAIYNSTTRAHAQSKLLTYEDKHIIPPAPALPPPSRKDLLAKLNSEYDIVVVGGGATGTGIAVDAASRGLKVALLERDDFSSGTSSRSTKLIHGGVRYLEKAVWNLDYNQYQLVREALHERKVFLDIAPHLSFALPIMIPVYTWWQLPYFWVGTKCYDLLAGKQNLESSYLLTRSKALEAFPQLNSDTLKGAIVYYDGSHNDSRMNVSLAVTAAEMGATVLNHVEVTGLEKDANGKIIGVKAKDLNGELTEEVSISAKSVINATGPFTDAIRKFDEPSVREIVAPSSGVHIVLPGFYSPKRMGLLDAATSDGRVIFFLPWQGSTIAGTTDSPSPISANPIPSEQDIEFILKEVSKYFEGKLDVRREDVLAAWSGIRPLVRDPKAKNTESLVRNHLITVSDSGLLTIAGGKWTTYRQMAQEAVDEAIAIGKLEPPVPKTATESLKLVGADQWSPLQYIHLAQKYALDPEVARHLSENYGTRAYTVAESLKEATPPASSTHSVVTATRGTRLASPYPFLSEEIGYAVKYEYAVTAVDFLARRCRLAFLDCRAAYEALPKVVEVMGAELHWSAARKHKEFEDGVEYLKGMGLRLDQQ
ncbi:uncharacterized protein SAPINGB_P004324 [Magnusiomyces paraingens]|uniref:Glycerol-3-phosphate dehydrogenase n=1 Tax=Magnusiomyces paraingens TaxID=2606893 RepID=A0A5E8BUW9_9ASCO|nr:uncharacterized protein SAPINGB_P004324 [Saprochaete ingens]VVT54911.1 unnamed protein product [Saprochaete ingens]